MLFESFRKRVGDIVYKILDILCFLLMLLCLPFVLLLTWRPVGKVALSLQDFIMCVYCFFANKGRYNKCLIKFILFSTEGTRADNCERRDLRDKIEMGTITVFFISVLIFWASIGFLLMYLLTHHKG